MTEHAEIKINGDVTENGGHKHNGDSAKRVNWSKNQHDRRVKGEADEDENGKGDDDELAVKLGDVEKEKQIEQRMRELGLWENKKELERRVAAILDGHISETDVLTRALRQCRRSRDNNKSSVDDVRNIIQPQVRTFTAGLMT